MHMDKSVATIFVRICGTLFFRGLYADKNVRHSNRHNVNFPLSTRSKVCLHLLLLLFCRHRSTKHMFIIIRCGLRTQLTHRFCHFWCPASFDAIPNSASADCLWYFCLFPWFHLLYACIMISWLRHTALNSHTHTHASRTLRHSVFSLKTLWSLKMSSDIPLRKTRWNGFSFSRNDSLRKSWDCDGQFLLFLFSTLFRVCVCVWGSVEKSVCGIF